MKKNNVQLTLLQNVRVQILRLRIHYIVKHHSIHAKMLGSIFSKIVHILLLFSSFLGTKKEVIDLIIPFGGTKILNSPGGSVTAGLGIYDTMQFISSDVATICTGMAASMAAVLLVSGKEGKRSALPHSRVMIHQPLGGVQGQASDIEIEAREILKMKKELYTIISEHSHTPYDKVYADSDRNYWMTAEEAKEYGMIDNVLVRK